MPQILWPTDRHAGPAESKFFWTETTKLTFSFRTEASTTTPMPAPSLSRRRSATSRSCLSSTPSSRRLTTGNTADGDRVFGHIIKLSAQRMGLQRRHFLFQELFLRQNFFQALIQFIRARSLASLPPAPAAVPCLPQIAERCGRGHGFQAPDAG